jgi:hypothetical protein
MFFYIKLELQGNQSSGRHHNTGQQRLYKFFYLLPIWLRFFSYKDVAARFGNFLVFK